MTQKDFFVVVAFLENNFSFSNFPKEA